MKCIHSFLHTITTNLNIFHRNSKMIYFWQSPPQVLLNELYRHNETREEERKLTFPEDSDSKRSYQNHIMDIVNIILQYYYNSYSHKGNYETVSIVTNEENSNDLTKTNTVETYNLFDHDMWTVSEIASVLKNCDILTRSAGREMDKTSLISRMKQVYCNTASYNVFKPSPLGHNWSEFWYPYLAEVIMTIATVVATLAGVHYLYTYCEHYHYTLRCSEWRKMYSLECYVLKKSRSYLEEMNYNLVYTSLCGLGIAMTGMFARAKAYATKSTGAA